MSEYPEEVHPENRRSASLCIEEMSSQISINQQHDLSGGQWSERNQNHSCHHQVEPSEQRHAAELHARTSQAKNSGDEVDPCSNASKPGNQERESPIIGTMSRRKGSRTQWRIGPPSDVGCVARSIESICSHETEVEQEAT